MIFRPFFDVTITMNAMDIRVCATVKSTCRTSICKLGFELHSSVI